MDVYILRHGKAEAQSPTGRDEDRALAARGYAQAAYLAGLWSTCEPPLLAAPEIVLASRAARAWTTAEIVAEAVGLDITAEPALFLDSTIERLAGLVDGLARRHASALLVGHNPLLEELIEHLTGLDDAPRLRTGELAVVRGVGGGACELAELVRLEDAGD